MSNKEDWYAFLVFTFVFPAGPVTWTLIVLSAVAAVDCIFS